MEVVECIDKSCIIFLPIADCTNKSSDYLKENLQQLPEDQSC